MRLSTTLLQTLEATNEDDESERRRGGDYRLAHVNDAFDDLENEKKSILHQQAFHSNSDLPEHLLTAATLQRGALLLLFQSSIRKLAMISSNLSSISIASKAFPVTSTPTRSPASRTASH